MGRTKTPAPRKQRVPLLEQSPIIHGEPAQEDDCREPAQEERIAARDTVRSAPPRIQSHHFLPILTTASSAFLRPRT
jgi:hypothetical protein